MILTGLISERPFEGEGTATAIGSRDIAEALADWQGMNVCVAYFLSDEPLTMARALDIVIEEATGEVDATLFNRYSELTGFLYTVENANVGGHDLIDIFSGYYGKYALLIVQAEPIDLGELADIDQTIRRFAEVSE